MWSILFLLFFTKYCMLCCCNDLRRVARRRIGDALREDGLLLSLFDEPAGRATQFELRDVVVDDGVQVGSLGIGEGLD